jgi:aminopeptidase 2
LCRIVPLNIVSVADPGQATIDKTAILDEREKFFALDTSKPFKVNAGTNGVCE